ncbi:MULTISPECIES: acetyl/propionyl/methylcrotonyl-CoA carboxylase subunit alpha [unclassified Nocardioides]|uniref:acetyl/propionyl/methylcrotonyl-CoA carboxylase subunit alpha n=1 Tax=unclassified Nocardioides TaxID=2615069 RepID=UPI0006F518BC|nr:MULTISPECIES: biotin carboxylase N-terminal domain-containing protein [unclassified Nocardioides]KQY62606.1 acetyl/propionyl-CoA carboxylase subuit alpha [Nocardioides sp. Root140]KRF15067.1 acetyl/propionyl-CoA carboxylase subuit alpha [Nocardioides sp. Soil796]
MINRLLVANRGEIARRVFRTCRDLGIETVAVHSDADADMPFVHDADAAVRLPGNTPAETYLRGDLVIEAARRAGADAIHPGYGFLSENAAFARQVTEAGLTWVGPDPSSIEQMGSKIESKKLMEAAGVPVLGNFTPETATEADLPLLVKASAGGGGRGMRIVRSLDALPGEIERAQSEAQSAFGDGTVFVEPYVENGRHIEVQVLGTPERALVFGERDCSVQRRHQKVIEEAPAPALPDATRTALHDAARAAAEAIDYRGAGTVEFLHDPARDRFYFLEMNTRLQVEHPVTEAVHGVDLVALQIAVAEGHSPDIEVGPPNGHAVEVRLYAEDPAHDYQPQSGRIARFEVPGVVAEFEGPTSYGVRLDSGVGSGDEIGTFYDAMIAKVIVHAPTREQALRQLAGTLAKARLHGLVTNRDLLVNLLRDPVFAGAEMHTTWLDTADLASLATASGRPGAVELSGFAAAIALAERDREARPVQRRIPAGFRNVAAHPQRALFHVDGRPSDDVLEIRWFGGRSYLFADRDDVSVLEARPDVVRLEVDGVQRRLTIHTDGDRVDVESSLGHVGLRRKPRFTDPADQVAEGSLLAPMPGSVISLSAAIGDEVIEGQTILVMEAMKMQHTIVAPSAGTITELAATTGQQVEAGAVLAVVSTDDVTQEENA